MIVNQQQQHPIQQTASKFVSSASQLDSNGNQSSQLVSIFANPTAGGSTEKQQPSQNTPTQPPLKMKVKPPNRNNIKEKEQLYEDAIKLKIQLNAYREENVKLKTKIKILENDMSKQEKAMEEFISKFQVNQGSGFVGQIPLLGQGSSGNSMGGNVNISANRDGLNQAHMISLMSGLNTSGIRPMLQQNETFLVMSLKKQVKELKIECLKKDEELETIKKSLKNTRYQEIEVEIKSYIDECQRLRNLLSTMLTEGPKHPLYQERLAQLEQQRQTSEFVVASLQAQNQELMSALQEKEQEIGQRQSDKQARKEIKMELSKAKKTLREKERELVRLRLEVNSQKKTQGNGNQGNNVENNSFTTKEVNNNGQEQSQASTGSANPQVQIKNLQKKLREVTNDGRAKRNRIEELEKDLKKNQDLLSKHQEELTQKDKKLKQLEEDLSKTKKTSTYSQNPSTTSSLIQPASTLNESDIRAKCQVELDQLVLKARKERISHADLCKKLKDDGFEKALKSIYTEMPSALKDLNLSQIERLVPYYYLMSQDHYNGLYQDGLKVMVKGLKEEYLGKMEKEINNSSDQQGLIAFEKFTDIFNNTCKDSSITSDHFDAIKLKHLEFKKPFGNIKSSLIRINPKGFIEDLQKAFASQSIKVKKPQLSKQGASSSIIKKPISQNKKKSPQQQQQHQHQLKKKTKDDVEDEYEDDHIEEEVDDVKSDKKSSASEDEDNYGEDEDFEKEESKKSSPNIKKKKAAAANDEKESSGKKEGGKKRKETSPDSKSKEGKKTPDSAAAVKRAENAGKYMDEEEMLDVAEHCFIRMAENLIERQRTARSIFTKYSIPEQFPDGTVLELLSPIGFLEGVKEAAGIEDLSEMEAACLLRVLAKPELDNAIILNEFTMIMENFGVPDMPEPGRGGVPEEDEDDEDEYDDYIREEDYIMSEEEIKALEEKEAAAAGTETDKKLTSENEGGENADKKTRLRSKPRRRKIVLNFEELDTKAHKILRKLARFLLERYMHPREFYGTAISRQMIKCKQRSHPVDILPAKDFYSRMKAAGVRRTVKENESLSKFLRLDPKFPHLMQMKRVVKALEEVAQVEQKKMQEEMLLLTQQKREGGKTLSDDLKKEEGGVSLSHEGPLKEGESAAATAVREEEQEYSESESEEPDEEEEKEEEAKRKRQRRRRKNKRGSSKGVPGAGANLDLMREAGVGGYMNDYFAGASKLKGESGVAAKMHMLMGGSNGFTQLNTIEEEKHETQTSNYFREGGAGGHGAGTANVTESERDYENMTNMRGSRILDEDLINTSSKYSPHRMLENEIEFPASAKHLNNFKNKSLDRVSMAAASQATPNKTTLGSGRKVGTLGESNTMIRKKGSANKKDDYEYEEEQEEEDQEEIEADHQQKHHYAQHKADTKPDNKKHDSDIDDDVSDKHEGAADEQPVEEELSHDYDGGDYEPDITKQEETFDKGGLAALQDSADVIKSSIVQSSPVKTDPYIMDNTNINNYTKQEKNIDDEVEDEEQEDQDEEEEQQEESDYEF